MYPSEQSKTYGIFVKNQVDLLREMGLNVDVIANTSTKKGKINLVKKYGSFFLRNAINFIFKGWKYDVVHVHYIFPTGLLALLYKWIWRKKLIITSHGGDIDQMVKVGNLTNKWTSRIVKEADHVISVGEQLKNDLHEKFGVPNDKISVINMGVNRDVFHLYDKQKVRYQLGIDQEQKMILFVGNLIYAKGIVDLAESMKVLVKTDPLIKLHLIGEKKDIVFFEKFEQDYLKFTDNIIIHDAKEQEALALWFSAADIFILPSYMEGFGLVALEAMACGTPVIGSDVGGLHHLLASDTGLKIQPKNIDDIVEKVLLLLNNTDENEKYIKNGFLKAVQYDQNKLVKKIISLYY